MEGESMIKLGTINKYIEGRAKDKYKNVVFLLDISKLIKYNHNFYISLSRKQNIPTYSTNIYFLKNSNKACCFSIDEFETSKK